MPTLLIAEDEPTYQDLLVHSLAPQGYVTHTVATGAEAIALGARLRADLLIADWLLRNHIHGLHVAAALRAVDPQLRVLLITGFDAIDLRAQAAALPGCRYLKKPFRRHTLLEEVTHAMQDPPVPPTPWPIAVVEIDATGTICYANPAAHALFATTTAGANAQHLTAVIDLDLQRDLDPTTAQWREVIARTPGSTPARWWLGVRTDPDATTRLLVLTDVTEDLVLYHPAVRLLLNLPGLTAPPWSWAGPALLVDANPATRSQMRHQLELLGTVCHTAVSPEEGMRIVDRNPALHLVVLADTALESLHDALTPLVTHLQRRQPAVLLLGTSAQERRADFAALGVPYFLRQPWGIATLCALFAPERGNDPW
jgi:CheY-like chemotaxis protein